MSKLSIFIDESGDFGPYQQHSPFYIVALVFHDQNMSIGENVAELRRKVSLYGLPEDIAVHAGPLIRAEKEHKYSDIYTRRKIFKALFSFVRNSDIQYQTFIVNKGSASAKNVLSVISEKVEKFITENFGIFFKYKEVVVYYDNGQKEITDLINKKLLKKLSDNKITAKAVKVKPADYALFQVADMICTLSLLAEKKKDPDLALSASEIAFFGNLRELSRTFLRHLEKKKFPTQ